MPSKKSSPEAEKTLVTLEPFPLRRCARAFERWRLCRMFLCRKPRGIFFTRLKNAQREACFTVLSGKSQIIKGILCFAEFTKMKHFGCTKDLRRSAIMIKGRVILFAPLHSYIFFSCSSALVRFCVSTDRPVDYFSYFLCEEHFNILC